MTKDFEQKDTVTEVINNLEQKIEKESNNSKYIKSLADIYFNYNDYEKAADTFTKLIRNNRFYAPEIVLKYEDQLVQEPKNTNIIKGLISLHIAEGSISEALSEIYECLELEGDNPEIISLLLKIAYSYKDSEKIIPILEKALAFNKSNSSLLEILAGKYLDQGNHYKAISLYENAVSLDSKNIGAWTVLAELYLEHGHNEKSFAAYEHVYQLTTSFESLISKLENIVTKVNDPINFIYLLAKTYLKSANPDKALENFNTILEKDPSQAEFITNEMKEFLQIFPDYPEANFLLSKTALLQGSYSESVTVLNKIVQFAPKYLDRVINEIKNILKVCPEQVLAIQSLGELYLLKSEFDSALDYFSKIIDLVPDEADKMVNKARDILKKNPKIIKAREIIAKYYLSKKNFKKAVAEAEALIAIDQKNVGAYLVLGRALFALNEIDNSMTTFKMALSLDPYNKETHYFYQKISEQKLDAKIMEMSKKISNDTWKYSYRFDLGNLYFHRGKINEAVGEFQLAVKDVSRACDVHKMLGICFKEQGRYDLAVEQFQKAVKSMEENDVPAKLRLLFYIGLAYEAQGLQQDALKVYEEIMTEDINYENIQLRMEKLKGFSWVEIRGKAMAAIVHNLGEKKLICSWAKNSESEEYNKKYKNKNIDLSFSLEHNNKAVEHCLKGRFPAAEEELLLAEQMDPKFTILQNNYSVIKMIKGEYEQAKVHLDRALELNKKLPIVYYNLAVYYHQTGKQKEALGNYEKSLSLDNSMYVTQISMGDLFYQMDDVPKAISCWERALQLGVVPELAKRRLKYRQV